MPTIMTHAAIGVALVRLAIPQAKGRSGRYLCAAAAIGSMAPDSDVMAFHFGIPYGDHFGHRGFSHSLVAAALLGGVFWGYARWRSAEERGEIGIRAYLALTAVVATHPLLDMLTDGGLGCALFAPFSWERLFFPVTPIPVSPIGPHAGVGAVFAQELLLFWPVSLAAVLAAWPKMPLWGRATSLAVGAGLCAAAFAWA